MPEQTVQATAPGLQPAPLVATVTFRTARNHDRARQRRRQERRRELHPARAARLLAQAHDLNKRLEAGEFDDYADIARHHNVSRARVTQVMNLLLLAPDIQAEVLDLRFPPGPQPLNENLLRRVSANPLWRDQRATWAEIRPPR